MQSPGRRDNSDELNLFLLLCLHFVILREILVPALHVPCHYRSVGFNWFERIIKVKVT